MNEFKKEINDLERLVRVIANNFLTYDYVGDSVCHYCGNEWKKTWSHYDDCVVPVAQEWLELIEEHKANET